MGGINNYKLRHWWPTGSPTGSLTSALPHERATGRLAAAASEGF